MRADVVRNEVELSINQRCMAGGGLRLRRFSHLRADGFVSASRTVGRSFGLRNQRDIDQKTT